MLHNLLVLWLLALVATATLLLLVMVAQAVHRTAVAAATWLHGARQVPSSGVPCRVVEPGGAS